MAMETPPRCPPLFIRKRELTEVIGSLSVPVQVCIVEGAPGHNRWGVEETPLPAKSQGRTGDCTFKCAGCLLRLKATQLSGMFRHPHSFQGWFAIHTATGCTAIHTRLLAHSSQSSVIHTRPKDCTWGGHATTHLGTVLHERQGADPRTAPFEGTPYAKHFLTSTSVTSCSRSYIGRDGYEPSLT